jgi:Xaa-Pro aminopeptidase
MNDTLLMVGDSVRDADLLYALGISSPDPFIYLRLDGKAHVVVSDQELNRARARARQCRVHALGAYLRRLKREGHKHPSLEDVVSLILRDKKIRKVAVPPKFPVGLAQELKRNGFKVKPRKEPLFPDRELKTSDEIRKISAALTIAEVGLSEGIQALRNSKAARDGKLIYRGSALTSERLRGVIDTAVFQAGGVPSNTIVAGGAQSRDPREIGHGPLFANQPIILEVSPRSQKTGYFGRITRTVVKGAAREAVRGLYHAVATAQELIFLRLLDGVKAREICGVVNDWFESENFGATRRNGRIEGMTHAAGHGIGLEPEESPYLAANSKDTTRTGHIISVKPGLYFNEIGGVRLEDIAQVTRTQPRNLTKFEKQLEV